MKAGLVGCGWAAVNIYLPLLCLEDFVTECAVYDSNAVKSKDLAVFQKVTKICSSMEELLALPGLDFVIIATPCSTHPSLIRLALKNRKHVYCEKPLAFKPRHAEELARLALEQNLVLKVAIDCLYRQDIKALERYAVKEKIGSIYHIEAKWLRKNGTPIRPRWDGIEGGALYDLGPHLLEVVSHFFDLKNIRRVSAQAWCLHGNNPDKAAKWFSEERFRPYGVEDRVYAHFTTFEQSACIDIAWAEHIEGDETVFYINGTNGRAELRTTFGYSPTRFAGPGQLTVFHGQGKRESIEFTNDPEITRQAAHAAFKDFLSQVRKGKSEERALWRAVHVTKVLERIARVCGLPRKRPLTGDSIVG